MLTFIKAYIKSMRLYYAFITGIAGWIGVAFYEYLAASSFQTIEKSPAVDKKLIILAMLFLSWGINQIINDYLGIKEDTINAPSRPMVTGELNAKSALFLSGILLIATFIITYFLLEPIAIIPALLGTIFNIVYEYAKGHGVWGNIVFGLMIAMCTVFGFLGAGPTQPPYFTSNRISVFILVAVLNGIMTFYTYFKDYQGDKASSKKTIVVQLGIYKSRVVSVIFSFIPAVLFIVIYLNHWITADANNIFGVLAVLTLFLELWTGFLYYKNPTGKAAYRSLVVNFRACACGQATLIALFNKELAMQLFIVSYIFIGFLFDLYPNSKC